VLRHFHSLYNEGYYLIIGRRNTAKAVEPPCASPESHVVKSDGHAVQLSFTAEWAFAQGRRPLAHYRLFIIKKDAAIA
jgi:hypothetical protein